MLNFLNIIHRHNHDDRSFQKLFFNNRDTNKQVHMLNFLNIIHIHNMYDRSFQKLFFHNYNTNNLILILFFQFILLFILLNFFSFINFL